MKNKLFTILATALLLVGLAGLASAASITFDFTSLTTTFFPTGLTFGSGLTVEATGDAYQGPPENTLIARGIHQDGSGIGVWSTSGDNDEETDNGGRVDRMYLDFSSDVLLTQATFTKYGTGDEFSLMVDGGPAFSITSQAIAATVPLSLFGDTFMFAPGDGVSWDPTTQDLFKLSSVTVEYRNGEIPTPIPEPATMLLLGTGLVGVAGAVRRRKKNQA